MRHRRIAFIAGPEHLKSAGARKDAFKSSMMEIGLSPDLIAIGNHRMEGGMKAFSELHSLKDGPTAVLCSNDMTAIGVMRQAYEQKIRVPEDLSVVGFDDIHLTEFTIPPLTTVRMSQQELARIAFRALLTEVDEPKLSEPRRYELITSLVLRRSTALSPAAKHPDGGPKSHRAGPGKNLLTR
jgi:LacI family transcriptional regulator